MSASLSRSAEQYPAEPRPAEALAPSETGAPAAGGRLAFWLALGAAVFGVVLGVLMVVWPEATLKVVAVLFGCWLLAHGVVRLVQAVTGPAGAAERAIFGVVGVFFVVAGVLALRNLLASLAVMVTVIGIMWLIGGIMELIAAFGGPGGGYRLGSAVLGVLSIVAALVVLFWPQLSLVTLVYLTGAWLIIMGLVQVALVFWARAFWARRALTA